MNERAIGGIPTTDTRADRYWSPNHTLQRTGARLSRPTAERESYVDEGTAGGL